MGIQNLSLKKSINDVTITTTTTTTTTTTFCFQYFSVINKI